MDGLTMNSRPTNGQSGAFTSHLPDSSANDPSAEVPTQQRTLKSAIGCVGIGLHSGRRVNLTLHPAGVDHGIVFRRTDLGAAIDIPARFERVVDTRLCTVLANPAHPDARIGTIEHLMAALAGAAIDNVLVEIDGPELPILDGSAAPFLFLLDCAGVTAQEAPRRTIEVLRTVRVTDGEAYAELRPGPAQQIAMSIDFTAPAIGRQSLSLQVAPGPFRRELARARTFTLAQEIEQLHQAGLAKGGSLDNAVVVDGARVLNPGGLRMRDEFVRHKLLDVVGDLALAGGVIRGRFTGHRSGHALNNRLLRALFADAGAFRLAPADAEGGWTGMRLPAAAAPL
jgi:UDP-3-O-[3-hydroxymyristoyl] N-acetylglucosamine deacetylase